MERVNNIIHNILVPVWLSITLVVHDEALLSIYALLKSNSLDLGLSLWLVLINKIQLN